MKRAILALLIVLSLTITLVPPVFAETFINMVVEDDFEDITGTLDGQKGWVVTYDKAADPKYRSDYYITNDYYGNNKCIEYRGMEPRAVISKSFRALSGTVGIEMSIMPMSMAATLNLYAGASNITIQFDTKGNIKYYDQSEIVDFSKPQKYKTYEWYNIKIIIHTNKGIGTKADYYINDVLVGENANVRKDTASINQIQIIGGSANLSYYFDDIKAYTIEEIEVEEPEPVKEDLYDKALFPSDVRGTEFERSYAILSTLGIMSGYEDKTFRPQSSVTRGEFCAVMERMLGGAEYKEPEFDDVPKSHWAYESIGKALGMGLISGYGDGSFGPDDSVTYEQVFKILGAALGYEKEAEAMGGYPKGWNEVVRRLSITEFEVADKSAPAIRGNIAGFIANALIAPQKDGKTFISALDKDKMAEKLYDTDEFAAASYSARIFMIGDSTIARYLPAEYPKSGWGDALAAYFGEDVMISNLSKEGDRVSKFAGNMPDFFDNIKSGDYVFISFGYDEAKLNPYPAADYKSNIQKIAAAAYSAGATPVIVTPVSSDTDVSEYRKALKIIALNTGALIIDLTGRTQDMKLSSAGALSPEDASAIAAMIKETFAEARYPFNKFFLNYMVME